MSDLERVLKALRAAAVDGLGDARASRLDDPKAGARHIARRIDRTVLPDRILVEVDGTARATLDLANRRLLAFNPIGPTPPTAADGSRPLGSDDADQLAEALINLCTRGQHLRLLSDPGSAVDEGGHGGLSASALLQALGEGDAPGPIGDIFERIEQFLGSPGIVVRSAISVDGSDVQPLAGTPEASDALADWGIGVLDVLLAEDFPLAASFETDGAYVFPAAGSDGHCLVACHFGQVLIAHIEGQDATSSLKSWLAG